MNNARLKETIEWVVLLPVRIRHRKMARKRRLVRQSALATTHRTLHNAKGLNAKGIQTVFNVALYLLQLDDDLAYFSDDFVTAIGERRRRFIAKYAAILLYEAAEDLPQLLGKEFRLALAGLGANHELTKRINGASSGLRRFWEQHRPFLSHIRNAVAAHREHDALAYTNTLDALKPFEVMEAAADFSALLETLLSALTEAARLTVGIPAVIADMRRASRG